MKSRFCPSPTGEMHLGNARTALFNALVAKQQGGVFLLRIEDTDQSRSSEAHTQQLYHDLKWLGLVWQEGPEVNGAHGPYAQSERQAIYDEYYDRLIAQGQAYPCFCTDEQLALNRKVQRAAGQPPRYPGTCRRLTDADVKARMDAGEKPTLRFKIPEKTEIVFDDLVKGPQRFQSDDIGDFIIRRADGTASFMYCNAIDDALMGVTHALRGEDHLTNTPRQWLLLATLGLTPPQYGHIALILGEDGAPLSKRNGSRSINDLRKAGYFAVAINNYLARLGHTYADNALMTLEALAQGFELHALGKSPARFDSQQLRFWQKAAVHAAKIDELLAWMPEEAHALIPETSKSRFVETVKPNLIFPEDALLWAQALFADQLMFDDEQKAVLLDAGREFFEAALAGLAEAGDDFNALANHVKAQCGVKGKALFLPLRMALTGQAHGPQMPELLALMGRECAQRRFEAVLALL